MNDNYPKVSVLLSVYNGQDFLKETIESVLNQTYKNFEFIIINDASTDDSKKILLDYKKKDNRIILIHNEYNIGLTKSLIKGLKLAKGEFIARQDSGDVSHPERLAKQVKILNENPHISLVGTHCEVVDERGKVFAKKEYPNNMEIFRKMLTQGQNPFAHGAVMFIKKHVQQIGGYNDRIFYAQDFELWSRMIKKFKFYIIEEPLYQLRCLPEIEPLKFVYQRFYGHYIPQHCLDVYPLSPPENIKDTPLFKELYSEIPSNFSSIYYLWIAHGNILKSPLYALQSIYRSFKVASGWAGKWGVAIQFLKFCRKRIEIF